MPRITLVFAGLLIVLGVGFKLFTETDSWTPLLPSIIGVVLGICGLLGLQPGMRKHAMHAAAAVALLAFLAIVGEAIGRPGAANASTDAKVEKAVAALLLLIYVALAVRSFIAARRARLAGA